MGFFTRKAYTLLGSELTALHTCEPHSSFSSVVSQEEGRRKSREVLKLNLLFAAKYLRRLRKKLKKHSLPLEENNSRH